MASLCLAPVQPQALWATKELPHCLPLPCRAQTSQTHLVFDYNPADN